MNFKQYEQTEKFYQEVLPLLLQEEAINSLMIGDLLSARKMNTEHWMLGKVEDREKTELILVYMPDFHVLLYSPTHTVNQEIYEYLIEECLKRGFHFSGVNAQEKIAKLFAKIYCSKTKQEPKICLEENILKLETLAPLVVSTNTLFRQANQEDLEVLAQYRKDSYQELLQEEITIEKTRIEVAKDLLQEQIYVLEKERTIVSTASIKEKLIHGIMISKVYTPPKKRGQGYATECVHRLSNQLLEKGYSFCTLYTNANYPISNHIYEKIGYQKIAKCIDIEFQA